jgi:hypothetical protein
MPPSKRQKSPVAQLGSLIHPKGKPPLALHRDPAGQENPQDPQFVVSSSREQVPPQQCPYCRPPASSSATQKSPSAALSHDDITQDWGGFSPPPENSQTYPAGQSLSFVHTPLSLVAVKQPRPAGQ